jgi:hypothetical protein
VKQFLMIVAALFVLALPVRSFAHEGHVHKLLGTVTKIDGAHVTLKTTAGKSETVMLDAKTTVTRGTQKVDASAIKVGQRISVDAMEEKAMLMAQAVKLSAEPAAKKP